MSTIRDGLLAWYPLDDAAAVGKDISGNGMDAKVCGKQQPAVSDYCGRAAAVFAGGESGSSYLQLPDNLLADVSDADGITVSAWICEDTADSVWERIFDFGDGQTGPYLFLTRGLRGVCFRSSDIPADAGKAVPVRQWMHVAMTVSGTCAGTKSSAGPQIYIDGELVADGIISQTSSGNYKLLREWWATLEDGKSYANNYIGRSQFAADSDYRGAIADFRVYSRPLAQEEILAMMCESLADRQILNLAGDRFLTAPDRIIVDAQTFETSLLNGRVQVSWSSSQPEFLSPDGQVSYPKEPTGVVITAQLTCGDEHIQREFFATLMPENTPAYELEIHGDSTVCDISKTLYGLFYEDINHAADGGIYAELVQNRSFEEFAFDTYDARSGENGISTGRRREPLKYWFGDTARVTVCTEGGLNEQLELEDADANACYVKVPAGCVLVNRGFCDNHFAPSMYFKAGEMYEFSIWSRLIDTAQRGTIRVLLLDEHGTAISDEAEIIVDAADAWKKYSGVMLLAKQTGFGQLQLTFETDMAIDMVSLMPADVWGAKEECDSASAHANYTGNPNYRLRRDLVKVLKEMNPTFLRFPGGCISEGSYIWDNVYDWKDSVGPVEQRKENFNVWGYTMTLGLGYMEYFQLSEDLGAEPLPVMACGVLCQARSDYANPAGGALREKYIANFTDLIDFAISTDFSNQWAALRRDMGHEAPFGLHYLGVGNENWGTEFYADFEEFKYAIDEHMEKNYPGYELHIISTAGAQADDESYQQGWKYLSGHMPGGAEVAFTDGHKSWTEDVRWYQHQPNYLDTIVDEHYYRSNEYLLENVDRYNYYYRPYEDGRLVENQVSKVFVGEYASTDKNTLAGAVAEAAVMTGFENNSDVVRLAATAPLFNKVGTDGTYRWTPDAIWFDDSSVWRTPNYFVQQMFARNIGTRALATSYATYENGVYTKAVPRGGILLTVRGDVKLYHLVVTCNETGNVLIEQDFQQELQPEVVPLAGIGYYIDAPEWSNYTVRFLADKYSADASISVAVGVSGIAGNTFSKEKLSAWEYCVGRPEGTGIKVLKDGREGYTMGDYSSSVYAGNLRACYDAPVEPGEYMITVNFGEADRLVCFYENVGSGLELIPCADGSVLRAAVEKRGYLDCKLEAYNRDIYHAVTRDTDYLYVKMVNADAFDKHCKVTIDDAAVEQEANWMILTADASLWHTPNVNTKEAELVVPQEKSLTLAQNVLDVVLPACSVSVIRLKLV